MSLIPAELRTGAVRVNTAARSVREMMVAAQIVPGTPAYPAVPEEMPRWYVSRGTANSAHLNGVFTRSVGKTPGIEFLYSVSGARLDSMPLQQAIDIVAAGNARYTNPASSYVVTLVRGLPGRDAIPATPATTRSVVTIGIAGVGRCAAGGVSAYSASAWCAVGLTRLRQSAGRIFGRLCRGVGVGSSHGTSLRVVAGSTYVWTAPFAEAREVRFWPGAIAGFDHYTAHWYGATWLRKLLGGGVYGDIYRVEPGATLTITCYRYEFNGGLIWAPAGVAFPNAENVSSTSWSDAVSMLEWADAGLPWWGTIDTAARAGTWVRRDSWTDASRKIRFDQGTGTTRAVAVTQTGAAVTVADFGAAEWLADDWSLVDATEPPEVDVTDWTFDGPAGAVAFAIPGTSTLTPVAPGTGGGTTPGTTPGTDPVSASEGFVYRRADGTETLIPGEVFATGATWQP